MGDADMANGRITLAVLGNKVDTPSDKIADLCKEYDVDHDRLTANTGRITTLETIAARPPGLCPAHDGVIRDVVQLRLDVAKLGVTSGMAGGGVVSVLVGIIFGVGKAAGWW